jgi:hypothetical protein
MVDELDRCRPDYAIHYIETIKHVFDVPGLTFVLAVDQDRLAAAATAVFGELNFDEYFRKFVHRKVQMPIASPECLINLARRYVAAFLEKEQLRVSMLRIEDHTVRQIAELVGAFQLTPRQTQEAFRIMGHVMAGTDKTRGNLYWCLGVATMLLSVLKVGHSQTYDSLRARKMSHLDFGKLLIERLGANHPDWWFSVYVTGAGKIVGDAEEDLESLFRKLGFEKTDAEFNARHRLGQFVQGWGHSSEDRIALICSSIESVSTF